MADLTTLDTCGLLCPLPIIRLSARMRETQPGRVVELLSDDVGILEDLPAWCRSHGHALLELEESAPGEYRGLVRKKASG